MPVTYKSTNLFFLSLLYIAFFLLSSCHLIFPVLRVLDLRPSLLQPLICPVIKPSASTKENVFIFSYFPRFLTKKTVFDI